MKFTWPRVKEDVQRIGWGHNESQAWRQMNGFGPVLKVCVLVFLSIDWGVFCYIRISQSGICGLEMWQWMSFRDSLTLLNQNLIEIYHINQYMPITGCEYPLLSTILKGHQKLRKVMSYCTRWRLRSLPVIIFFNFCCIFALISNFFDCPALLLCISNLFLSKLPSSKILKLCYSTWQPLATHGYWNLIKVN